MRNKYQNNIEALLAKAQAHNSTMLMVMNAGRQTERQRQTILITDH